MVFSKDVLFLHVPKTGGTSATHFLLKVLPRPVYYVFNERLDIGNHDGLIQLHDRGHQTLAEAGELVARFGFDLSHFPLIMAAIRNPYALAVSHYTYQVQPASHWVLLDQRDAPPMPVPPHPSETGREWEEMLSAIAPGRVARIEPTGHESSATLRDGLLEAAVRIGRPVHIREHDGLLFASVPPGDKAHKVRHLARNVDFRTFVAEERRHRPKRNPLNRLVDFYQLDGHVPSNFKIVRSECLADDVRAALRELGIAGDAEFPWLNRTNHETFSSYYDAETEVAVYSDNKWMFDRGLYQRLAIVESTG